MRSRGSILFLFLVLLNLVPIWLVRYLPTQDGPIHLSIANVLLHYGDPAASVFREYYDLNLILHPNWIAYFILLPLLSLFSPAVAEKLFVSFYVVLFPLSFWYLVRAIKGASLRPPFLIVPFILNYTLLMGFYNFTTSFITLFLTLGYWFRHRTSFTPFRFLAFSSLSLLLCLSHLFSFLAALAIIFIMTPLLIREESSHATGRTVLQRIRDSYATTLVAFLPGLSLTVQYLVQQGLSPDIIKAVGWRLQGLAGIGAILALDKLTILTGAAMAFVLLVLGARAIHQKVRTKEWDARDGPLLLALLFVGIYMVGPDALAHGGFILHRLNLLSCILVLLWLELQPASPGFWRGTVVGTVVITIALVGIQSRKFLELGRHYDEYLSASAHIEPNSTVLPLMSWDDSLHPTKADPLAWRIHPFLHAAAYISAERHVIALENFQAKETYFPIKYHPSTNPYTYLARPHQDFLNYPRQTRGVINYILLWDPEAATVDRAYVQELEERIRKQYDLCFSSPAEGSMRLYKLREGAPRGGK